MRSLAVEIGRLVYSEWEKTPGYVLATMAQTGRDERKGSYRCRAKQSKANKAKNIVWLVLVVEAWRRE